MNKCKAAFISFQNSWMNRTTLCNACSRFSFLPFSHKASSTKLHFITRYLFKTKYPMKWRWNDLKLLIIPTSFPLFRFILGFCWIHCDGKMAERIFFCLYKFSKLDFPRQNLRNCVKLKVAHVHHLCCPCFCIMNLAILIWTKLKIQPSHILEAG